MSRGTPSLRQRRCRSLVIPVVLCAALVLGATAASAADGVTLTVSKGPAAGDLTLSWTGGQPVFDVYRSTSAPGLVAPGNHVANTSVRTLVTGQGTDNLSFFVITSPCVVDPPERCDGVDNDCNGTIDDPGAESSCSLPNATPACTSGACAVASCDTGYVDCDGGAANGCEVAAAGFPTDPLNCGSCNNVCPSGPNATPQCAASTCTQVCDTGYADCNSSPTDGCEVGTATDPGNCSGCGLVCPNRPHAAPACVSGSCSYVCNSGFVDCNGAVADGCEVSSASFPTNSNNCGGCNIVCALPNAHGVCSSGTCQSSVAYCDPGYVDLNGVGTDGCEYACTPTGVDLPDDGFVDANCDGIDGDASAAVFVSPTGNDSNPGTRALPRLTVNAALGLASTSGKSQVYLDQGLYPETVQLVNGISLYGGYSSTGGWSRSAVNVSQIRGSTVAGGTIRGVTGSGITSATTLDRLTITTTNATASGVSTYGVYCISCPLMTIKNCTVTAGNGGSGVSGATGAPGASGGSGLNGGAGSCDTSVAAPGGGAGTSACGRSGGGGGGGAYGQANGSGGGFGVGGTSPGAGGPWGDPGSQGGAGLNGASGSGGSAGPGGSGGSIVGGFWSGSAGATGAAGNVGNGGGGGGGGGGQYCFFCTNGTGNGGGGGGAGGCGGAGGTGGAAGGGSFGVFFVNTTGFVVSNSTIQSGSGGAGGLGSFGGTGGTGGSGGAGNTTCTAEVGRGGNGGAGGSGGSGGSGGGGAGGASFCVYRVSSVGTIAGCTLVNGPGGSGGSSPGNPGAAGASGTIF